MLLRWRRTVDTIVIYTVVVSKLWKERQDRNQLLQPREGCDFGARGLPLGNDILRQNIQQRQRIKWSLFTAFYTQTQLSQNLVCTEKVPVSTFNLLLSGPVLLPRTDHGRQYNDDGRIYNAFLARSSISWEGALRSRLISAARNRLWFWCLVPTAEQIHFLTNSDCVRQYDIDKRSMMTR